MEPFRFCSERERLLLAAIAAVRQHVWCTDDLVCSIGGRRNYPVFRDSLHQAWASAEAARRAWAEYYRHRCDHRC